MKSSHNTPEAQDYIKRLSEQLTKEPETLVAKTMDGAPAGPPPKTGAQLKRVDISDELTRAQRIKNDDAEQNIMLKKVVLNRLFKYLGIETTFVFLFVLLQATHWIGFSLQDWTFDILITATIAQIAGMLFVAVRYLFPNGKERNRDDRK